MSVTTSIAKYTFTPENLPAIRSALETDGIVTIVDAFQQGELDELTRDIEFLLSAHARPGEDASATLIRIDREDPKLLYRIYKYSHSSIAVNRMRQACLQYAQTLLPGNGIYIDIDSAVIFNLPQDQRLTWTWHQESAYHPHIARSIAFWFPFVRRATVENGTMSVLLGSHTLGRLPHTKYKPREDAATSLIPEGIERHAIDFPEVPCVTEVGELVLFQKDLIHRSNFNHTHEPRFTGLVRLALIDRVPDTADKAY